MLLGIDEKVECLAKPYAFITLKDPKENFTSNPKCRLINPAKSELGKVSTVLLNNINRKVRDSSKVDQWHITDEVIEWFENIEYKKSCIFVQFDIEEFYPSISRSLLDKEISHAMKYLFISNDTLQAILHSRKSLLFNDHQTRVKKSDDPEFDVTMGSYDGAMMLMHAAFTGTMAYAASIISPAQLRTSEEKISPARSNKHST